MPGRTCLYVPATQLDLVSKYIGGRRGQLPRRTRLEQAGRHRLGQGQDARPAKAAKDLAKGLISSYAQRQRQPGYAFSRRLPVAAGV